MACESTHDETVMDFRELVMLALWYRCKHFNVRTPHHIIRRVKEIATKYNLDDDKLMDYAQRAFDWLLNRNVNNE